MDSILTSPQAMEVHWAVLSGPDVRQDGWQIAVQRRNDQNLLQVTLKLVAELYFIFYVFLIELA